MRRPLIFSVLVDYVSAPYRDEYPHIYKDGEDEEKFFRPALRHYLVSYSKKIFSLLLSYPILKMQKVFSLFFLIFGLGV